MITARWITVATEDGPMEAFVALPEEAGPRPAVVIAQEAFGVNDHIRDVCERFARAGFAALAPELYHRDGKGLVFGYDELPKAREHLREVTNEGLERDVVAALSALRAMPEVAASRVGIVGYCMGGFVAFLAACRTDVASTVVYYGGGIVNARPGFKLAPTLGEAERIRRPLLGLFGAEDASIPPADVEAIRARLKELGKAHELVVYEGAGHGFSCDPRASFHAAAAADAWSRTRDWLALTMPA
jgi:carboxymethylenebutenolidase